MYTWILILLLTQHCASFDVRIDYLRWSGLTARISIGTPPQPVEVALDFTTSDIVLWEPTFCPAFIRSGCFDPPASSSLLSTRGSAGELSSVADYLHIDTEFTRHIVFDVNQVGRGPSRRGRDVAGTLGVGLFSPVFRSLIVGISSTDGEFIRLQEVARTDVPAAAVFSKKSSVPPSTGWMMEGAVVHANGVKFDSLDFAIDFAEPDIHIPGIERLLDSIGVRYMIEGMGGKVSVPCDEKDTFGGLVLRVTPGSPDTPIEVPLGHSIIESETLVRGWCNTRLVNGRTPIIGLILLESVSELFFNYKNWSVGMVLGDLPPIRLSPRISPIPIFSTNFLYSLTAMYLPRSSEGLILRTATPTRFGTDDTQCWEFSRTSSTELTYLFEINQVDMSMFSDVHIDISEERIAFVFDTSTEETEDQTVELFFIQSAWSFEVCRYVARQPLVDLPTARVLPHDPKISIDCSICLTTFAKGDTVQDIPVCGHEFHERCIHEWVRKRRNLSCPVCRAEIPTKDTDTEVVLTSTTPEPIIDTILADLASQCKCTVS